MVQVRTIDELEALYYGQNRNLIRKADAPVVTSTAGVFNAVFGAYAWAQLNLEANAFGILPKTPWDKSGWRAITAKPTLNSNSGNIRSDLDFITDEITLSTDPLKSVTTISISDDIFTFI